MGKMELYTFSAGLGNLHASNPRRLGLNLSPDGTSAAALALDRWGVQGTGVRGRRDGVEPGGVGDVLSVASGISGDGDPLRLAQVDLLLGDGIVV